MTHPADLSATDLLGLYRKKAWSPVEAAGAVLAKERCQNRFSVGAWAGSTAD